jgi:hypothetical protein
MLGLAQGEVTLVLTYWHLEGMSWLRIVMLL